MSRMQARICATGCVGLLAWSFACGGSGSMKQAGANSDAGHQSANDSQFDAPACMECLPCPALKALESSTVLPACTDLHISTTCGDGKVESGELCFRSSLLSAPLPMDERPDEGHALGAWLSVSDADDDGAADLIAVSRGMRAHHLVVYWGRADGSFSKPSELGMLGTDVGRPVVVDFDADGKMDIGLVSDAQFPIFYGSSKRSFERHGPAIEYDTEHWWEPSDAAFVGQFNDDEFADVVLNGGYELLSTGARTYAPTKILEPGGFLIAYIQALADFDGDGTRDLLTQLYPPKGKSASIYVLPAFRDDATPSKILIPGAQRYWDAPIGKSESGTADVIANVGTQADDFHAARFGLHTWRVTADGTAEALGTTELTTLTEGQGRGAVELRSADLDQNGTWDLLFAAGGQPLTDPPMHCDVPSAWRAIHLVLGHADGTYTEPKCHPALSSDPIDFDTGDLNGDGATDIAVATWDGIELLLSDP